MAHVKWSVQKSLEQWFEENLEKIKNGEIYYRYPQDLATSVLRVTLEHARLSRHPFKKEVNNGD